MMKKLTNIHLQLKSAFQKGDGKKRKRPLQVKAMQGQSLLQSKKLADTGDEKKLAVTATARNLNKKVETFYTDWKNRALLPVKNTPEPYGNQDHTRMVTNRRGEAYLVMKEKVMELWSHKIMHSLH